VVATFADRRWVFPRLGCALLSLPNTTAELLARHIARCLAAELARRTGFQPRRLQVAVDESNGQWGIYESSAE
jgi:6-pyruvoyltetrahydropterin/6-carboxytetrahydropterin synthase